MPIKCYFDGSCLKNPGTLGSYGYLITEPWIEGSDTITGKVTNNVAEFTGLIELLKELDQFEIEDVIIYSDSKLVVNIVTGEWKARKKHLKPLARQAKYLLNGRPLKWIPREENHLADQIANEAYK